MGMLTWNSAFFGAVFLSETLLITVLVWRREYRRFPIFLLWMVTLLLGSPLEYWVLNHTSVDQYAHFSIVMGVLDYMLQVGVLVEIAHSVLRPAVSSMPGKILGLMAGVLVIGCVITLLWTFDRSHHSEAFQHVFIRLQQLDFAFAFMRLGLFVAIAGFSQMVGVTWKSHILRLAAGLAFYSAVSLVVQLTLSHLPHANHLTYQRNYYLLNYIQTTSYLGALVFWVWSFVQKDVPRREFTPQMQRILVTIAQTTRRNRASMTRSLGHK